MFYRSTKTLLDSIIRQLKAEAPAGDEEWRAQTDLVQTCLEEMVGLSEPASSPLPGSRSSRYVHRPAADKLNRAMPYVQSMLAAIRNHDRISAVVHGEIALQRL